MFFPLIYLDAARFLVLSLYAVIETTCPKIKEKTVPNFVKSPLPVDVRGHMKTSLLKVPKITMTAITMTTTTIIC